jgi:phage shock protein A
MMGIWQRIKLIFNIKTSAALDQAEDPREVMDYAHIQQVEFLRKVKQGLVEVSTAKHQLQGQLRKQGVRVPQLEDQAARAVVADREDLARTALQRKQYLLAEMSGLEQQLVEVTAEEQRLITAEREIAARIEQFSVQREVMSARYSAAEAQVRISESLTGVSGELGELSLALGRAEEKTQRMLARASALDNLIETGALEPTIISGDYIEVELQKLSSTDAIETELAALKAGQSVGELPPPSTE